MTSMWQFRNENNYIIYKNFNFTCSTEVLDNSLNGLLTTVIKEHCVTMIHACDENNFVPNAPVM